MGVYLSTPVTDKVSSDNKCKSFTYGESSMQGWRQTQEDAHNCSPDFDPDSDTSLFAVYDGHGGAEVAQYCAVHLPVFIRETEAYKSGNLLRALEDAFLGFDDLLTKEHVMKELKILAGVDDLYHNTTNAEEVAASRAEAELLKKEAEMPLDELLANYDKQPINDASASGESSSSSAAIPAHIIEAGGDCGSSSAGSSGSTSLPPHIRSFVGKQNWQEFLSPLLKAKKFESETNSNDTSCVKDASNSVSAADAQSGASGCRAEVSESGTNTRGQTSAFVNVKMSLDSKLANGHADNENNMNTEKEHSIRQSLIINNNNKNEPNSDSPVREPDASCCNSVPDRDKSSDSPEVSSSVNCQNNMNTNECIENKLQPDKSVIPDASEAESKAANQLLSGPDQESSSTTTTTSVENSAPSSTTDSSKSASSSLTAAAVIATPSSPTSSSVEAAGSKSTTSAANTEEQGAGCSSSSDKPDKLKGSIFHPDSSEDDEEDDDEEDYEESEEEEDDEEEELMDDSEEDEVDEVEEKMEPIRDMEEPGVDSGCTAVVALVRGSQLVVANAGDSRCILSRDGKAVELSFDHKPEDDPERSRIEAAGGSVTSDGRVNGGLNLSRAIGDHFYKRNQALPAKQQMITAFPDIQMSTLGDDDEFMVLACDGIWNFMTSQEVVDFVKVRLSDPEKRESPSKICEEMFDYCLAPNTMGDGTGCDNMTCIIVLLDKARKGLINTQPILDISTTTSKQLEPHAAEPIVDNAATAFSSACKSAAGECAASSDSVFHKAMDDLATASACKRAASEVESSSDVDSSSVHPEKRPKLDASDDSEAEAKETGSSGT